MKKSNYGILALLLAAQTLFAQAPVPETYFCLDRPVSLFPRADSLLVFAPKNFEAALADARKLPGCTLGETMPVLGAFTIKCTGQNAAEQLLAACPDAVSVYPAYYGEGQTEPIWARNAVNLQMRPGHAKSWADRVGRNLPEIEPESLRPLVLGPDTLWHFRLKKGVDVFAFCRKLRENEPFLRFAEPDFILTFQSAIAPNDLLYPSQWHLPIIEAPQAWDLTTGDSNTRIAVLDGEGYDMVHTDMAAKYTNGYDAAYGDADPSHYNNNAAHGTPCASLAAGDTDNQEGVAGVAFDCAIVPINMGANVNNGGFQTTPSIITDAAIIVVGTPGVVAVSNSYTGGYGGDIFMAQLAYENMMAYARGGLGAVVLASTGNAGQLNPNPVYPCSFDGVVGVGGTNNQDLRWSGSNYGDFVDVAAPGQNVQTADRSGALGYNNADYTAFTGTSAACPIAAGVVALMGAANPALSGAQLRDLLEQSCDIVGGYNYITDTLRTNGKVSEELGYGRVNAYEAVCLAIGGCGPPDVRIDVLTATPTVAMPGDTLQLGARLLFAGNLLNTYSPDMAFYLSTQCALDSSAVFLGELQDVALGGGIVSDSLSIAFALPLNLAPGIYYILLWADYTDEVPEGLLENNNVACAAIEILPFTGQLPSENLPANGRLFPNPATGPTVWLSGPVQADTEWLGVYDALGQRCGAVLSHMEGGRLGLDVSALPSGWYLVQWRTGYEVISSLLCRP